VLYRNALGNDPATWAAASPVRHVADPGPHPRFLVVTQGSPRRTAQARAFAAALEANGTPATAIDVSPLDHEALNAAVGAPGDEVVTPAVLDLFRSCVQSG
jgi:acetyl esterase/lipase